MGIYITKTKTIHEIAKLANVSIGTVSRVVNDRPNVKPDTRKRVKDIVEKFGYRPSAMARGLQRRRTDAIMLIVSDIADLYYPRLIKYLNSRCREAGLHLILGCSDWNPKVEAGYLRQVMDGFVDGLIISPASTNHQNAALFMDIAAHKFPVVTIENECPGASFPTILYDDAGGARSAVVALARQGHKRIGYCACNIQVGTVRRRYEGYLEGHRAEGLVAAQELSLTDSAGIDAWDFDALIRLLHSKQPPTAILTQNDFMALRIMFHLEKAGIKVPKDLAVVGYGDIYPAELLKQQLSSVAVPWRELCDASLSLLRQQISHIGRQVPFTPQMLMPSFKAGSTS